MNYLILDVVTSAAILFIIASGLLIIFGVMKVINFAHAGFLTMGGYASLIVTRMGWDAWWSFPMAFVAGCVLGAVVERLILRYLYDRPLDAILATWGLGIIVGQVITVAFGREVQFTAAPVDGAIDILGAGYSQYRLWLIAFAVAVAMTMWLLLQGTRIGLQTRAVIMNEPLARGLGIKSARVRAITFAFGSGLACLAGAFIAPLSSVDPNLGIPWLVSAFMLVLVSGNSLASLAIACLILGGAEVVASTYISPVIGGLTVPVLAALLLRIRPQGLARD
jgi:urea transport system permease protein